MKINLISPVRNSNITANLHHKRTYGFKNIDNQDCFIRTTTPSFKEKYRWGKSALEFFRKQDEEFKKITDTLCSYMQDDPDTMHQKVKTTIKNAFPEIIVIDDETDTTSLNPNLKKLVDKIKEAETPVFMAGIKLIMSPEGKKAPEITMQPIFYIPKVNFKNPQEKNEYMCEIMQGCAQYLYQKEKRISLHMPFAADCQNDIEIAKHIPEIDINALCFIKETTTYYCDTLVENITQLTKVSIKSVSDLDSISKKANTPSCASDIKSILDNKILKEIKDPKIKQHFLETIMFDSFVGQKADELVAQSCKNNLAGSSDLYEKLRFKAEIKRIILEQCQSILEELEAE